jgi:hypothetical protein
MVNAEASVIALTVRFPSTLLRDRTLIGTRAPIPLHRDRGFCLCSRPPRDVKSFVAHAGGESTQYGR